MDIMEILEEKKKIIWPELKKYLPDKEPKLHYKMLRDYPERGGKYLRGGLVLIGCEVFGGDWKKAIKTAAAMEASQNWVLIHDDIEDESAQRRGKPTLHKIYGTGLALNVGDALHIIMWKMLADNAKILGETKALEIMQEMANILTITAEGQTLEMQFISEKRFDSTEQEYYKIIDAKAGVYTTFGPLKLGAIIAGAKPEQIKPIEEFGIPWGRAFQIQDDVLNLTAGKEYGKAIGDDILEGKLTLILIHLLKTCIPQEKKKVIEIYKKTRDEKSGEDVMYVLDLMNKYGSVDYAKRKSLEFAEQSTKVFDKKLTFLKSGPAKDALRATIDFVAKRKL